jgi:hypothetical protein
MWSPILSGDSSFFLFLLMFSLIEGSAHACEFFKRGFLPGLVGEISVITMPVRAVLGCGTLIVCCLANVGS